CPDIHQNTAALYMRLAENADAIADCNSIREADMKLRQPRTLKPGECGYESTDNESSEDDSDDADDEGDNSQRVVRMPASQDLTAMLLGVDVDEVCTALIDAWDEDHIRQLCDRLRDHFTKRKDDLSLPPAIRRSPAQPTL